MAILKSSKTFEGGELAQRSATYLKPGTRLIDFKNKDNGVYLFLLGAYKLDSHGQGVWYRTLKVRDNFGMGMFKEKFAVQPFCPIEYFANKVQTFAPDMAKSREIEEGGRKRWIYPAWGRIAYRVLYNSALYNDFNAGPHVLDLPQNGGATVIDEFVRGKQPDGSENPMVNDPDAAIPINIKLDLKAQGQPWKIQINPAKVFKLPNTLADTDYLYNLDEVICYPDKDELIEKLRSLVPTDVFEKGMEGYTGNPSKTTVSMATPTRKVEKVEDDDIPFDPTPAPKPVENKTSVAPKFNLPQQVNQGVSNFELPPMTQQTAAPAEFVLPDQGQPKMSPAALSSVLQDVQKYMHKGKSN